MYNLFHRNDKVLKSNKISFECDKCNQGINFAHCFKTSKNISPMHRFNNQTQKYYLPYGFLHSAFNIRTFSNKMKYNIGNAIIIIFSTSVV